VHAALLGSAPHEKLTVKVAPAIGVTFSVNIPDCPAFRVTVEGTAATLKSGTALTVCVIDGEVLPAKFASPPYAAVIGCEPCVNVLVAKVAIPLAPTLPVPNVVDPSRNVTVPVIVPAVVELTVAVKVAEAPTVEGFNDDVTAVAVIVVVTVCVTEAEVLAAKLVSPP